MSLPITPQENNWTLLRNGNFTKLIILLLLGYVLGMEGVTKLLGSGT